MRALGARILAGIACASLATAAAAADPPPTPAGGADDPRAEQWLAEVAPLLSDAEREAYRALTRPYQRTAFEKRFWEVRDPQLETAVNEFAEAWRERAPAAIARWGSFDDARAVVYAAGGAPRAEVRVLCTDLLLPMEIWTLGEGSRANGAVLAFVSSGVTGRAAYRVWDPGEGLGSLAAGGRLGASRTGSSESRGPGGALPRLLEQIATSCARGWEVAGLLQVAIGWDELVERTGLLPRPNPEWLRAFAAASTDLPASAQPLAAALDFRFPARRGLRTLVEGALKLGQAPATPAVFQLEGDVLRGDELFEQFRYRFPARPGGEAPFVFERPLRPGRYRLVVRLHQVDTDLYYRETRELEVPELPATPPRTVLAGGAASTAPAATAGETVALAAAEPGPAAVEEASVRLLVPDDRLVTGKLRVEAATRGAEVAAVAFALDGKPLLRKLRAPFGVELDLGRSPRVRTIEAIAYDAAGAEVARHETLVNGGPHRFALRLVEPRTIEPGAARVVARAEVDVPDGERLDRVEFHLNDELYATLYQAPFVQPLPVPATAETAWIRSVAYLRGGGAAEDVKLIGAAGTTEEVDVDLVELHASVLDRRARPVSDLRPEDFTVLEDGVRQSLRRCEFETTLPIHAGVMIDTSASMSEDIDEAEHAALQFMSTVLTERDRGAVITFSEVADLAVRFTGDLETLAGGLAGLEAEGDTHLWDSLAFALHYFSGLRSKRVLTVITDGEDSGSRLGYDEVLEYARRTGVAIYIVGLDVNEDEASLRLDRLARETGGRSFRIDDVRDLAGIYAEISTELRSQYLIAYQSSAGSGEDFREVEVRLARPGLEARTVRGYYP